MNSRPTPRPRRAVTARAVTQTLAGLAVALAPAAAPAQYYGGGGYGDSCGCSSPYTAAAPAYTTSYSTASLGSYSYGGGYQTAAVCTPVAAAPSYTAYAPPVYQTASVECAPVQTVAVCAPEPPRMVAVPQQCTARVPVTKYVQSVETVKRPRTVTRYEEREFTEMVPQTETRTAMAQQVSYRPVAETRTVMRDRSFWRTRRIANPRVSPCQYDPRPGFAGSMNRFGYNVRSMFTPRFTTRREYVPQQVACNVTTTRQVAEVQNVPQTYQVTTMVPVIKKRQVAVQEVVWEDQKVTAMKPVTEYREVSRTVYNYMPSNHPTAVAYLSGRGTTATALAPTADSNFRSAEGFGPVPSRSADSSGDKFEKTDDDDEFGDTTTGRVDRRPDRRAARPTGTEVAAAAPKVRSLTAADVARLKGLRVAAARRGAAGNDDARLAARPSREEARPQRRRAARPAARPEGEDYAAARRVPRVDRALRWDAFAGPSLPAVAAVD